MATKVRADVIIRPALETDIPSLTEFHAWYVLNTIITFRIEPATVHEQLEGYRKIKSQSLPYIVAVPVDDYDESSAIKSKSTRPIIQGFSYVSGFRSGKAGYSHTVELSLFCHPEQRGRGIGTMLLNHLLSILREPEMFPGYGEIRGAKNRDERIRQVLAVMALDTDGKDAGEGLANYYKGFGFEERGRLKEVGHKFGKWIDTVYLQLSLP